MEKQSGKIGELKDLIEEKIEALKQESLRNNMNKTNEEIKIANFLNKSSNSLIKAKSPEKNLGFSKEIHKKELEKKKEKQEIDAISAKKPLLEKSQILNKTTNFINKSQILNNSNNKVNNNSLMGNFLY